MCSLPTVLSFSLAALAAPLAALPFGLSRGPAPVEGGLVGVNCRLDSGFRWPDIPGNFLREDRARWDDALIDLPVLPTHGRVAGGADSVPPPAPSFELRPAAREVFNHVVYVGAHAKDVDLSFGVAWDVPPSGGVVHPYTRGVVIELEVGDLRGRGSDRGLSSRGRAQLT